MKNMSVLIKPASGRCNLACDYCFYLDEMGHRETSDYGMMSDETAENIIKRSFEYVQGGKVHFAFQGGEPLLRGIDFFKNFIETVSKFDQGSQASYAVQTNGVLVNQEWSNLFYENGFLVGLSLDGTKKQHDLYRRDLQGKESFNKVINAAERMMRHGVSVNILTVVHRGNVEKIHSIYNYYKKKDFRYLQFIPVLDPLEADQNGPKYAIDSLEYEWFLKRLFDLWYHDLLNRRFVSIRYFENLLAIYMGRKPESCEMNGMCVDQHVVESNGDVFPCDFYVLDKWRLGNVDTDSFESMEKRAQTIGFVTGKPSVTNQCDQCKWRALCNNGCKRYRVKYSGEELFKYCEAYQGFFAYAHERFMEITAMLNQGMHWKE